MKFERMSTLERARLVKASTMANLTPRQKEWLAMSEHEAIKLASEDKKEWYERICLLRELEAWTKVINIHENMPAPEPLHNVKAFEPVKYR